MDAYEDAEASFAELADKLAALVKGGADAQVAAFSLGAQEPPPVIARPVETPKKPLFKQPAFLAGAVALGVALIAGAFLLTRGPSATGAPDGNSENVRIAFFGYTSDDDPAAKQAAAVATEEGFRALGALRLDVVNRVDIGEVAQGSKLDRAAALGARVMIEGNVSREGDKLRVTGLLVEVPTRTTIGQGTNTYKIEDAQFAGTSSIQGAVAAANCLMAYVQSAGVRNPDAETVSLLGDACRSVADRRASALRELLKRYPDNGFMHAELADSLTFAILNVPASQRPSIVAEADAALAAAEKLAPDSYSTAAARVSVAIAHDRPPAEWLPRAEAALGRTPSRRDLRFYAAAKTSIGMVLLQFGRTSDAELYVRAANDTGPFDTITRYYHALLRAASGQYGAPEGFKAALSQRVTPYAWEVTLVSSIFMDALDPEVVLKAAPESVDTGVPCYRDLIASLKAQDTKTRLAGAKRADACLTKFDSPHVNILAQAVLGDLDRAFALADRPDLTQFFWNYFPTLFLPPNSAMRADPRFLPLMQKLGYVDYWKQTKTQPDICATPEERDIPLCQALR